jgi:hypothetical protein
MSTDPVAPRHWDWRESASAVAVAAIIAALGGAAIYATTEGTLHPFGAPHQPSGSAGAMLGGPDGQHGAVGRPGQGEITPPALHGEFVVADGTGGYATELTQTGVVTAMSPVSITVHSQDGFTQTYVIPNTAGTTSAPFAVDDEVVVHATRNGQTATVTTIGNPLPRGDGQGGPPMHRN